MVGRPPTTPADSDDSLAQQGLLALQLAGGPHSVSLFQHYLDATGTYQELPVGELLQVDSAFVAELDGALRTAVGARLTELRDDPPSGCARLPFSSDWAGHEAVADPDWHYSLGRFYWRVVGTVAVAPPDSAGARSLEITFRAMVGDTYNFDPGSAFERFRQLALDGHAAEFLDGGQTAPVSVRSSTTQLDPAAPDPTLFTFA